MEVSKREALKMVQADESSAVTQVSVADAQLEGEDLIQTLVSLTGLPEALANEEVNQILELSGHQPETKRSDLTLDELRAALIAYLETLEPEFPQSNS